MKLIKKSVYDSVIYFLLLFFVGSLLGFVWEVFISWFQHSDSLLETFFDTRGFLSGTWVPIYGIGLVTIVLLTRPIKEKTWLLFLYSSFICGIVEYVTSWGLENLFHMKLWDYSSHLFNLHGRISVLSVVFFGIAGVVSVKVLEPYFRKIYSILPKYIYTFACTILSLLFLMDCTFSFLSNLFH